MAGSDPSQYLNSQMALQGALYNTQPQPVYSYEEMQLLQQSLLYAQQQGQSLVPATREAVVSPPSLGLYSIPDASKYKTNPAYTNLSLAQSQQIAASSAAAAAAVNGTYMTMAGNGQMIAYNPYSVGMAMPNPYTQYAAPTLVQIPSTSNNLGQLPHYPVQPKFVYGGVSGYNETMSPQTYQKPGYAPGTPPPSYRPDLVAASGPGGVGGVPLAGPPNPYAPMLISPVSPTSQYPSSLVHHSVPPQESAALNGRRPPGALPGKIPNKPGFPSRPNWGGPN